MRNLKLPAWYKSANPFLTTESDFDEASEIRKDSGRILSAALAIEQQMVQIIASTLLKEVKSQKELVVGSILNADWCTFAAKRKLLYLAIETFELLNGIKKSNLEKNLSEVIKYRNAFAHGVLAHNLDRQELHYFEGKPIIKTLDEAYFKKLECVFLETWNTLNEIELIDDTNPRI